MFLEYGNESIHFKHKPIERSPANPETEPDELILDGQQRLTSLYNTLYSRNPVHTRTGVAVTKEARELIEGLLTEAGEKDHKIRDFIADKGMDVAITVFGTIMPGVLKWAGIAM